MSINGAPYINGAWLPFVQNIAVPNTLYPYTTLTSTAGPFNSQFNNIVNYGLDICKVTFINT